MKVLQLCHKMPYPLRDGGAVSLYNNARGLLRRGIDLRVFAMNPLRDPVDVSAVPEEFRMKTRFECAVVDTRVKPARALINLFGTESYFVERFWSEAWKNRLTEILEEERFDIIQMEHIYLCLYLSSIREHPGAKVILRTQNVEYQVWKHVLKRGVNPLQKTYLQTAAARLEKFERRVAKEVDGIVAISGNDAGVFRSFAPGIPVMEVPAGVDFSPVDQLDLEKQYENFPVFYHIGSMDWYPNIEGLKWFAEEVIPHVKKMFPNFVFRMAGKKMPAWFYRRQDASLVVDGEVEDSMEYQSDKAILIVPLLSGGGLRVKIIEGMALGKTIISTTVGARGIESRDGENILIADSKEAFAVQIGKCFGSKAFCREIGSGARQLARREYDCNSTARRMVAFYEHLIKR